MESAVRCMPDEDGRKQEGGLCLDLGRVYPDLHDQPRKLIRTDTPPFWIVPSSRSPTTAGAAWGGSRAGSPPSPHLCASLPALGHRGVYHSLGAQWTQRPLAAPFKTPGMAGDATLQVCSPFTAAQRHELHRQALIFKCFMASTPVPLELLFSGPRAFPDDPSPLIPSCFDYLNLRFTGNNVDVEPSRCRRTDGKKWRCSKDVEPGHKYCERHMHRARPRSRKPVEHDKRTGPASADGAAALPTTSSVTNHAAPANTADPSPVATTSSPGVFPTADLKFPFQLMVPQVSCLGSGRGDAEQWQLLHSKMDPRNPRSVWQQQQQRRRRRLNLNCTSLNDHRAADPDQRDTPPQLIDALSRENYFGFTISDKGHHHQINGCSRSCVPQPGNPSPSNLTLSMSGSSEDHDENQTGLGTSGGDSVKAEAASWTNPVVPHFGGPLAEVLQSRSTVSFQNACEGGGGGESVVAAPCGWPLDLMSRSSCVSEGASPRDSRTTRFS